MHTKAIMCAILFAFVLLLLEVVRDFSVVR